MIEHVLIGKHLIDPKTKWMIYRETEDGANKAEDRMRLEPNGSKIGYSIMRLDQCMESLK